MIRILIDMNLSPSWADFFKQEDIESIHWSEVGEINAADTEIFSYAKAHHYIVFTHDLDFGAILAATNADAPSVIQVRAQDIMPNVLGKRLLKAIYQFEDLLENGALLTLDETKQRIRVLPLKP